VLLLRPDQKVGPLLMPNSACRMTGREGMEQKRTAPRMRVHVHRKVHGMLRRLNEVFVQRDISIIAQCLETDSEIGYAVPDGDLT
jgi:hypothetical protein